MEAKDRLPEDQDRQEDATAGAWLHLHFLDSHQTFSYCHLFHFPVTHLYLVVVVVLKGKYNVKSVLRALGEKKMISNCFGFCLVALKGGMTCADCGGLGLVSSVVLFDSTVSHHQDRGADARRAPPTLECHLIHASRD